MPWRETAGCDGGVTNPFRARWWQGSLPSCASRTCTLGELTLEGLHNPVSAYNVIAREF